MFKYILILVTLLVGCSKQPTKPSHFICITAFGTAQFNSDDEQASFSSHQIQIEQETQTLIVDKSMCVEVREK